MTQTSCVQGPCPYVPLQQELSSKPRWTKSVNLSDPNNFKHNANAALNKRQEAAGSSPMKTGSGLTLALSLCSWTVRSALLLAWTQNPIPYTSSSLKLGAPMWLQRLGKGTNIENWSEESSVSGPRSVSF